VSPFVIANGCRGKRRAVAVCPACSSLNTWGDKGPPRRPVNDRATSWEFYTPRVKVL
jgi:hypothetical protein